MGSSYPQTRREQAEMRATGERERDERAAALAAERGKLAGKIIMVVVDKIVADIVRPGPKPEERECYEMAGELREIVPDLERLVVDIINVNNGVR